MIITIDVGNTNTVVGLFSSTDNDELADHWRAATMSTRTSDEWLLLLGQFLSLRNLTFKDIDGVVIASVVPTVTDALRRMCDRVGLRPLIVDWQTDTGMTLLLDDPREIGADRVANAVAAHDSSGRTAIVVDLGTATTLDVISANAEYLGGVILPGIEISLDALFSRASALRRIELTEPLSVIGKSTAEAVRSGATYGYAAQVDGLCDRIENELGECRIIGTGGLSATVSRLSRRIQEHDPWLTLRGLRIIYQRNRR